MGLDKMFAMLRMVNKAKCRSEICPRLHTFLSSFLFGRSLTLLSVMTASWFTPEMLKVSPDSPSRMVYSSSAFSSRSASVAEMRPISAPGIASSETEKDHIPERERGGGFVISCTDALHLAVKRLILSPDLIPSGCSLTCAEPLFTLFHSDKRHHLN